MWSTWRTGVSIGFKKRAFATNGVVSRRWKGLQRSVFSTTPRDLTRRASQVAASTATGVAKSLHETNPNISLTSLDTFERRHNGPSDAEVLEMLNVIGVNSLEELMDKTVPGSIRSSRVLNLLPARTESEALEELQSIMKKNKMFRTHLGAGYYNTKTPNILLRNILENPGWYTPYTPYQAEISQGRLEMLLNYQTLICDLTGLQISNCSLLDEATAAAEAVNICASTGKKKNVFLISENCHSQTIEVVRTRSEVMGITIKVVKDSQFDFSDKNVCGILLQYPGANGEVTDYEDLAKEAKNAKAKVVVAADLLALTLLKPPGEWGADITVGSAQRFGVPMGFGGPHAGFMSVSNEFKRKIPGRVIGVSRDSRGKPALRMAMQTREQHIRRDKATSNICTAQALLANMAAAYSVYHGPEGLKNIARRIHLSAAVLAFGLDKLGFNIGSAQYFDTVHINLGDKGNAQQFIDAAASESINLRKIDDNNITISFDETTDAEHIDDLYRIFGSVASKSVDFDAKSVASVFADSSPSLHVDEKLVRKSEFLTHPTFNSYHSEHEMLRYLRKLEGRDLGLNISMIPLGSCTMKLNATSEMIPVTWPETGNMHPFAPEDQTTGYQELITGLEADLCELTRFHAVSLQPNSGSQGEYAGLMCVRAYHQSRGDDHRDVCLIPVSAHGTNPASAVFAGMKVVVVGCDERGDIDMNDLRRKIEKHKDNLGCLMATYPSTHGVFEESIKEVCSMVHEAGGQVYMDGANMNAQIGYCSPGEIGADVCHLNLHKTFCIPHGGGGPGMGPIGVAKHLAPFLPNHPEVKTGGDQSFGCVAAAPYSSASILPISWMYIRMMGADGLKKATEIAILNANYMAARLRGEDKYDILYTGSNGFCAHEFIIDARPFKQYGIKEADIAKRLQDFNFHAPTMSWPVSGTLMVEPTESESKFELDRFVDAMLTIRKEIQDVIDGKVPQEDNPLVSAPHTSDTVCADDWNRSYSRTQAAFPSSYLKDNKFWPSVGRIDDVYGDRHVVCTCPPLESYEDD